MKKYSVRPAKPGDLEAVYEIIAKQRIADFGAAMISLKDLQKKWENTSLENDTLAAFADGHLAGYAELRDNEVPLIYVRERNNTDLAFQLLMLLEQKATSRAKGKVELFTQISEKNQMLLQLFASNGYHSNLSFITMEQRLDEVPPTPPLGRGSVRPRVRAWAR
jgi:hypothetical protein